MSKDMMPQRWDLVGEYDSYMSTIEEGDWVKAEDVEPLVAEITRLRDRVEVLEAALHAIFPDGANIKLVPKASAEEAKP
jgi:hypothetical protein